ncbi:MAG: aldo/keto reductase [Planctomycetes bacterium]|nr:aldo/keto reductase [Planctomycetota bacterium]
MIRRRLGQSDLELPVIVLGAWAIGGWQWGGSDDEAAVRAIQAGIDAGMNAVDTAPVYGFGHSEEVVGRAIAGRRKDVLLLTKVGLRWDDPRGEFYFKSQDQNGKPREIWRNAKPDSVVVEVEQSLARMRTNHIDLVQIHWPDPTTPIEETMGALAGLVKQGKVRAIGVSNFNPAQLKEAQLALAPLPLASNQPKYSLVARDIEARILPFSRELGIGTIVYSPLEQGLLSGKVPAARTFPETDGRHKRATFQAPVRARVNALLEQEVRPIAQRHKATLAQTVLAWTTGQPGVTCAIAGARTPEQARENAGAGSLVLSGEELATIRLAFERLDLSGTR